MAKYLYQLRQEVADLMGEMVTGTPDTNLAANTFGCAALAGYEDDYFNDWHGRFYTGTHKDTSFTKVSDFVQTAGVTTFTPSLAAAVEAGDLFEMYPDFTPEEINRAINLAISMVGEEALQDKVDATLETAADTYEYTIPSGFVYIDEIFQESGTADRYSPSANRIDLRHWRILHGTTPKIWFDNNWVSLTAGRNLRLVGQQSPSELSLDADECDVSEAYIVYQAKANLHFKRSDEMDDAHWKKMTGAQTLANLERGRLRVAPRGRKVSY